jgi:hypothetical protein
MSAIVRWANGGEARVLTLDASAISLQSTVPSPPGSRIEGIVAGAGAAVLRVKVHSSRRLAEGEFLIQGRPLDLPREIRERVEELLRERG